MNNRRHSISIFGSCAAHAFYYRKRSRKIWSRGSCYFETKVSELSNPLRPCIGFTDHMATSLSPCMIDPDAIKSR